MVNFLRKLKTKYRKQKNTKKGFSLVETVIALAVISIVGAASVSMMASSAKTEAKTENMLAVTNLAENAVECFRFADDNDEFFEYLQIVDSGFSKTQIDGESEEIQYSLNKNAYTVTLTVSYLNSSLKFIAYGSDRETLYSLNYGGGSGS